MNWKMEIYFTKSKLLFVYEGPCLLRNLHGMRQGGQVDGKFEQGPVGSIDAEQQTSPFVRV
jgi:hypothetical protein